MMAYGMGRDAHTGDLARTYYAGDPVRTAATLYRRHDAAPLLAYIARALGQETATPAPR
jgi:hypothetical protein